MFVSFLYCCCARIVRLCVSWLQRQMAQSPLTRFFQTSQNAQARAGDASPELLERPKFVDLFCGAGGASCGAQQAGYDVVLAVDSWAVAVEIHYQNHPNTAHICTQLPPTEPLPLPTGCVWHLHGSPPCTKLSIANQQRVESEREEATDLIRWYIIFAIESDATSWTMEQVATPAVIETLEMMRAPGSPYRNKFEYAVFDFVDYGVPQERKRLLAGSRGIIARFQRLEKWHRSVQDVIREPRGTHTRNNVCLSSKVHHPFNSHTAKYRRISLVDGSRPVSKPAFTVVAKNCMFWAVFQDGPEGEAYKQSYNYRSTYLPTPTPSPPRTNIEHPLQLKRQCNMTRV